MDSSRRTNRYDLFKVSVAILLLILFFVLNQGSRPQAPALLSTVSPNASTTPAPGGKNSPAVPASPTSISSASTPAPTHPLNVTSIVKASLPPLPSATVTNITESTSTKLPEPTGTPLASPTPDRKRTRLNS